jgi:hypothetical protein
MCNIRHPYRFSHFYLSFVPLPLILLSSSFALFKAFPSKCTQPPFLPYPVATITILLNPDTHDFNMHPSLATVQICFPVVPTTYNPYINT